MGSLAGNLTISVWVTWASVLVAKAAPVFLPVQTTPGA